MGSPADEWGHPLYEEDQVAVTLTRAFEIQQTEVTREQWLAAALPDPVEHANDAGSCATDPACPVANVTWFEAIAYANLLSEHHDPPLAPCYKLYACSGKVGVNLGCGAAVATAHTVYQCEGYRLPTDAEWEFAARAGTNTAFYSGNITAFGDFVANFRTCNDDENLDRIGWYCANSGGVAHPVKGLEPNAFGLYDMAGNVAEWINDRDDGRGATSPTDPDGTVDNNSARNVRGGFFSVWASACRMGCQSEGGWNIANPATGFRLVRTLHP